MLRNLACGYEFPLLELSLELGRGEHVVVYGPNGTGKTTLLKTVVGLIKPLSGEVLVLGKPPRRGTRVMRNIFYLPETVELPPYLRVGEYAKLVFDIYGERPDAQRIKEGMKLFELESLYGRKLGELSQGQKRKVQLLVAYSLGRELTVLDDPAIGIDDSGEELVRILVEELSEKGAVLVTSRNPIAGLNNVSINEFKGAKPPSSF